MQSVTEWIDSAGAKESGKPKGEANGLVLSLACAQNAHITER
jgi:hypothetical protein